jgi:hypothetical protein
MSDDSAAVQYDDSQPSDPGPAVDLDWDDSWTDEDDNGDWAAELGNDLATPAETQAEVARRWNDFRSRVIGSGLDEEALLDGVEKVYSTSKAAAFFGRSTQWIYWGLRKDPTTNEQVFNYKDGTPIEPERINSIGKRRFTLPLIREIALSCYRRGNVTEDELEAIMAKILLAEFGRRAFADAE